MFGPGEKERAGAETVVTWAKNGQRRIHRYQIRNVRDTLCGIRGICGTVPVGFTWSTKCWFWNDKDFGGYINGPVDVHHIVI